MAEGLSLASKGRSCLADLGDLCSKLNDPNCQYRDQISSSAVEDEASRFKVWANNIGALQGPQKQSSLEHRLREAPQVRQQVIRLLDRLSYSATQASSICAGNRPNRVGDDSDLEEDGSQDSLHVSRLHTTEISEIRELFLGISGSVTRLFKLSMVIRHPAPRDRYQRLASIEPLSSYYDTWHVREKFPAAEKYLWLVDRLGKANAQRRDFFRYRRKHKERLAKEADEDYKRQLNKKPGPAEQEQSQPAMRDQEVTRSRRAESSLGSTKASTFVPAPAGIEKLEVVSDTGQSETSYATSVDEESFRALHVPPPPTEFESGLPFECPYCYTIQSHLSRNAWKKHVFNDLQPYICTFEGCAAKPFASRNSWFDHELQAHRKEWVCSLCAHSAFQSSSSFQVHIQSRHKEEVTERQIQVLIETCAEPLDKIRPEDCLLCSDWGSVIKAKELAANVGPKVNMLVVTPIQFRRHLAGHLEQLALFALPRDHGGDHTSKVDSNDAVIDASSDDMSIASISVDESGIVGGGDMEDTLYVAAALGNEEEVRQLLEDGADANARGVSYDYALQAAAHLGFYQIVELLIKHGAVVNPPAIRGRTAIQLARAGRHENIVSMLLKAGADHDQRDERPEMTSPQQAAVETPSAEPTMNYPPDSTILEKVWGRLFDENAQPMPRLNQLMRGIANVLIEQYEPRHSIVISPSKMQRFYIETLLPAECYQWTLVFDHRSSSISRLYRELGIEHHLVQEDGRLKDRPEIPALTPGGFAQWMTLLMKAHPREERGRLRLVLMNMAVNNPDDKVERFPKEVSVRLFPAITDYPQKERIQLAIKSHCHIGLQEPSVDRLSGSSRDFAVLFALASKVKELCDFNRRSQIFPELSKSVDDLYNTLQDPSGEKAATVYSLKAKNFPSLAVEIHQDLANLQALLSRSTSNEILRIDKKVSETIRTRMAMSTKVLQSLLSGPPTVHPLERERKPYVLKRGSAQERIGQPQVPLRQDATRPVTTESPPDNTSPRHTRPEDETPKFDGTEISPERLSELTSQITAKVMEQLKQQPP